MKDGRPQRVCIVLLTGLGDVVMGLPIVEALRAADPGCHVTWVVEPIAAPILAPHPAVDDVIVYHKKRGWRGVHELRRELAAREFDLTLNLNIYFKSIWPTWFSGAPRRIGFGRDRARDGVWLAATEHVPPRRRRHTVDMFLEFLDVLGIPRDPPRWRIPFAPAEREAQRAFFESLRGRPVAAVVAASANGAKDWLPERYAEVVDALERDHGFHAVLVGGPGERENGIAREIVTLAKTRPTWALGDGVRRLAWLIDGSDLVVAPDTGPVHLARALEVPVIGLYGHTNPWRVGPYRRYEDLWVDRYTEPGSAPDPSDTTPKSGRMEQITAEDVLGRVALATERYLPRAGTPAATQA